MGRKMSLGNKPFSTAWPYMLWQETSTSCETLADCFTESFFEGIGGSRECELRLCCGGCSSATVGNKGLAAEGNISGACLLISDEEINEPLNFDKVEVPTNVRLGDGTLLYRSIDFLEILFETKKKISFWNTI